ncbi:BppU family phage baseplate upper protein [Limosilactobacillus reuteri]|uniref:BppU family phage baseplate upper protein n=1 Tax=Limosilactobacillus reuteri TaxID=1598 RepID=UPI001E5C27B8|nr:BppU family phage baseplate upper protein [Limosilactobacillus reuteri]MCC4436091.1 BppU family phage baseplate upper protein [Limosilactobacillus reuteri]MCC4438382.1 BppU family phage baseplate upper protein [Limosilactobacillus reuteri]MCC4442036.1 BppU family phage baseplate upper protein [Limosilactobacillus reuteri]MCC4443976.1 BppU family phage baseplate upper protein [Limosilactobacillus reuteri]MCC4446165.1 BppU family phage baseplate upper protein [Limosilactobacillus reuteri]
MSQTLTYVIGQDRRTHVDNMQDFKVNFDGSNTNWVQARQYERSMRQVFVNIKNEDGTPLDLTGCNVWFEGLLPKNSAGDFRVIDDKGYVALDPTAGRFRFDMPGHAFTVAGSYRQAFFRILKDGNSITTLEFDLDVLADKVIDGLVPRTYISPVEELINEIEAKYQDSTDKLTKMTSDFIDKFTQSMNTLKALGATVQNGLDALEQKIKQDGLFTQAEADAFKQEIQKALQDTIDSINKRGNRAYATVADMQKDSTLAEGTTVETRGYYAENDGGATTYKVTANPVGFSIPLDNGLKAEQINSTGNTYYDEITWQRTRDHDHHTTIYTVEVPKFDEQGNLIMPSYHFEKETFSPNQHAQESHSTLTINGSAGVYIGGTKNGGWTVGNIINDGKAVATYDFSKQLPGRMRVLAIMKDRSIREYLANGTTTDQMIADGAQVAFPVYFPLVKDGIVVDMSGFDDSVADEELAGGKTTTHNPAIGLGEKPDGSWLFIGCDGRRIDEDGLTAQELAQKFVATGCIRAWRLDGGGSTSISYCGYKLNKNLDDNGWSDRKLQGTIDFIKPTAADNANSVAVSKAASFLQNLNSQLSYPLNTFVYSSFAVLGNTSVNNEDELKAFLDEVAWRLNESQMVEGAHLTGILTVRYTNSSIAQALHYPNLLGDFIWDYTCSAGAHNSGMFKLTSVNDNHMVVWKQFTKLQDKHWSQWVCDNIAYSLTPKTKSVDVVRFSAFRLKDHVEINALINVNSSSWTTFVTGLPVPAEGNTTDTKLSVNKVKPVVISIDSSGQLIARADTPDQVSIRFTYTAAGLDMTIPY